MLAPMEMIRSLLSGERLKHPIPPMDGALSPNSRLDTLTALDLELTAPDDVASDGNGGLLVSSDTQLLAVDPQGQSRVLASFPTPLSAFVRLNDGTLVVALDGEGLQRLDATGQPLESASSANGTALAGITALAADSDGGLYFTVGSTRHPAAEWARDLMECNRDGLLGYWRPGSEAKLLRSGLAFPNGALVENDGHHLIITESWNHSVTRYPIQGDQLGTPQVLIDNMPGYPARISAAAGGGYWLAAFAMRTLLVELILKEKAVKQDMMKSLPPDLWIRPALSSTGSHLEPLQMGAMKQLGIRKPWAPPRSYGLLLRLNSDAEVIDSLHSRFDGHHHGIMAAREIDGRLLIVSKGANSLLSAPLEQPGEELS